MLIHVKCVCCQRSGKRAKCWPDLHLHQAHAWAQVLAIIINVSADTLGEKTGHQLHNQPHMTNPSPSAHRQGHYNYFPRPL